MTRQKRPVNFTSLPPNSSFDLRRNSNASVKSMGTGSGRLAYEHSRSGSFDSYLDLSKDEVCAHVSCVCVCVCVCVHALMHAHIHTYMHIISMYVHAVHRLVQVQIKVPIVWKAL